MNRLSIVACCLMLVGAACSSTTEPDKPYENFQLEIVWPRAADERFVGRYEITWLTFGPGSGSKAYATESGTVTSGQIPAGQDTWRIRFYDRCRTGKGLRLSGYYKARGQEAECVVGRMLDLECSTDLQTIVMEEENERSEPWGSD
ncbi:MAG: hypothetical protein P8125_14500, partial [Gemmatimonadota bacterium]